MAVRENRKEMRNVSPPRPRGLGGLILLVFVLILALLFIVAKAPGTLFVSADDQAAEYLSLTTEEAFTLSDGEAEQLYPFNSDHLVKISNDLVSYISFKGAVENTVAISTMNPLVTINKNYILVADQGAYNFYLLDNNGLVLQGKTSSPIEGAAVSLSGKTAFIMDEIYTKGVLRVLDEEGKHILDWRVRDRLRSGYIISMAFTEDNQKIDVSLLNTDGAALKSYLTRLDLQEQAIVSSLSLYGSTAYPLIYPAGDDLVFTVGSTQVLKNQGAASEPWLTFDIIQETSYDQNGLALLASPVAGQSPSLYYFAASEQGNADRGSAGTGTSFGNNMYGLTSGYGMISVAQGEDVYIAKQANLAEANQYACKGLIVRQFFLSESHLLVITENSVQVIRV